MADLIPSSRATVRVLDLGEGLNYDTSPANLSPGSTISSENWVMREGGITPRPGQIKLGNNPAINVPITGGKDIITSEGVHFQLVSGTTLMAYLNSGTSWSNLSWIPGFSGGRPPNPATLRWWVDQSVRSDGSAIAFMAPTTPDSNASGGAVCCWRPGEAVWSTLTGNVPAKAVVSFSNYLILWSTGSFETIGGSSATYVPYPTRVQWSDRGNCLDVIPSSVNLAGFEDLLDAKGRGTGAAVVENKVILFTEDETWQGVELGVPGFAQFQFSPLDRSVGCRRPFTIQNTPEGVMFVGQDNYIYLIQKTGGPPVLLSKQIAQILRNNDSSWAVYNIAEHRYELYATVPSVMSAEIDNVLDLSVGYYSSTISWENVLFTGAESIEIWTESGAGWAGSPSVVVPYGGFAVQGATIGNLNSASTYRFGLRAVREGVYTEGYNTPLPSQWVPGSGIDPFSDVVTTSVPPNPADLAPPTQFFQTDCVDYSQGPKQYTTKTLGWTESTSTYVVRYEIWKNALTSTFNPTTAFLYKSVPSTVHSFDLEQLAPPHQILTRTAFAVRGVTLDYGLGVLTTAFSNSVAVTNQICR